MRIIPAIDIIDGKCVRLQQGNYEAKSVYSNNPLEIAKSFEDAGLKYLHLIDLDGARSGQIVNHKVLEQIARYTNLIIDFGGGIKADDDLSVAFNSGATQVNIGSVALTQPFQFMFWLDRFGADKIILSADCRSRRVASLGWTENSPIDIVQYISDYQERGVQYVACTDILKDGMLKGPSLTLYNEILEHTTVKLIASGGISTLDHIHALSSAGCESAIVGKAIYERHISLKQLSGLC